MGVQWTKEQQQVIQLRDRNILVSAAAGSGKTAVLVERIISMITDPQKPMDIDRLLIVTFTKAAAGEMRERIGAAIEKLLEEEPENEHLQRQSSLIHSAQIMTIDSFCSYVVRNYFHLTDLDPGYRMGEEGEMKLLKADVAAEVLEEAYENGEKDFLEFIESYSTGKTDEGIEEMILKLYEFSMSYPWPKEWLESCRMAYQAGDLEELEKSSWMEMLVRDTRQGLDEIKSIIGQALEIAGEEEGPYMYTEALESDLRQVEMLLEAKNYEERREGFANLAFVRLSAKKDQKVSENLRDMVKELRNQGKEALKELGEQYYFTSTEEMLQNINGASVPVQVLIDLTLAFGDAFAGKKREKNLLDFSDLEHFALEILVEHGTEGDRPSAAARELSERYEEILIDEYQDSNFVQEKLLTSVSRLSRGEHNLFMVGDVKQSIYRFRLARPELFMEKFHRYTTGDSSCQRIDLHKNFRSRSEVLAGVNFIFRQIMGQELGGVEYNQEAALYPGAVFPPQEEGEDFLPTEVLLVEKDDKDWKEMESEESERELEARAIGSRILQIVGKEQVLDKKSGEYRPARYQDCVILLRTITGWADVFGRVLGGMGIPVNVTSRTGYFSALEVVTVLNYLHICDNPRQDIPFAGVLTSPLGGFSAEELAVLKAACPELNLYNCLQACEAGAQKKLEEGRQLTGTEQKVVTFFALYDRIRRKVPYTPIHQLLKDILRETGYMEYAAALPEGELRRANLQMLIEKAMDFEKTSYRGLFNFIRYIEYLRKYSVDFGEASISSENEDTVRIMSIHKSKGLEFPVVFVGGMGKRFNQQDARSKLVLHPDLGIGADCIDHQLRTKCPTLMKKVIQRQTALENLGEELRVLYVALTRAKEKLILTGTIDHLEKKAASWQRLYGIREELLPYGMLSKAGCYWDWILPALARHRGMEVLYQKYERTGPVFHPLYEDEARFQIRCISPLELVEEEAVEQGLRMVQKERFQHWDTSVVYHEETAAAIQEKFSFIYPFENLRDIPVKVTVSEVKSGRLGREEAYELLEEPEIIPYVPDFMKEESGELTGAARGTAYHRLLECLDYGRTESPEAVRTQIDALLRQGRLTAGMAGSIRVDQIWEFCNSPLGQRMRTASLKGMLHREQQFMLGVPASSLGERWNTQETVVVQGIIDGFFYEEDGIVLVDYKTDWVPKGRESFLTEKYRTQLDTYGEALERLTGNRVKEKIIYSFYLGKGIPVKG
jgi:ATP-dependent helicase/nuclease subunit A